VANRRKGCAAGRQRNPGANGRESPQHGLPVQQRKRVQSLPALHDELAAGRVLIKQFEADEQRVFFYIGIAVVDSGVAVAAIETGKVQPVGSDLFSDSGNAQVYVARGACA
jgi:hypothetical protein